MPRKFVAALTALPALLALAACAGDPGQTGSIAYTATASSKVAAAGVLGNGLGASLDERDRQRAYAAEMQALEQGEPGEPVGWRGGSGRHGTVVPGGYYETRGVRCRDYSHTIYSDGRPQTARATACRNPDGSWSPVG
jgi:surface antigen